ncbi:hypothetical protein WR25_02810 [Diploscapter pachys]|uniref:CX domain-containing protein n=1 Tax=Diploscapter pachys TaxID=2018661 RepID=A0A2A2LY71_9BILA|nr:hypothetical protein WR25_02810 [Diploscapter pachys]
MNIFSVPSSVQYFSEELRNSTFKTTKGYLEATKESEGSNSVTWIVVNASTPFEFDSQQYFWGLDYLVIDEDEPVICVYPQSNNTEFANVKFSDGTPVTEIVFACPGKMHCYFYECANSNGGFW